METTDGAAVAETPQQRQRAMEAEALLRSARAMRSASADLSAEFPDSPVAAGLSQYATRLSLRAQGLREGRARRLHPVG